jgi:hemerythrin
MNVVKMLTWRPEYSVGIPEIDEQHRHLFEIANNLTLSVGDGTPERVMRDTINELRQYIMDHFHLEERIMEEIGYQHFTEHVDMHAVMTVRLKLLEKNLLAGKLRPVELVEFMESWLTEHIIMDDMRYVPALRAAHEKLHEFFLQRRCTPRIPEHLDEFMELNRYPIMRR